MSKSIYEEALKELTRLVHDEFDENPKRPRLNVSQRLDMFKKVKGTLKQAQKQEKLLELYKMLSVIRNDLISYCEVVDDDYIDLEHIEIDLENQIKELEK